MTIYPPVLASARSCMISLSAFVLSACGGTGHRLSWRDVPEFRSKATKTSKLATATSPLRISCAFSAFWDLPIALACYPRSRGRAPPPRCEPAGTAARPGQETPWAEMTVANSAPALRVQWSDGRLVGKVVSPGPTYFGYAEEWLAQGYSLSPLSVPFTPVIFRQRSDGFDQLPGFLSDCLPDQWGRRLMERDFRELHVTPTPLRMLGWVGRRGLGALSFAPALEEPHSSSAWERVTPLLLAREAQAVMSESAPEAFRHLRQAGTAGGAYPKATVGLLRDGTLVTGGNVAATRIPGMKLGILKLDVEDDPLRPSSDGRVEAAYLRMARAAGIRTVRAHVMSDTASTRPRHHLFVDRFDLAARNRRLHLLTLAGALHRHNLTYIDLLVATRDLTSDRAQVLEAVRRM